MYFKEANLITIDSLKAKLNNRPIGAVGRHKFFSVAVPVICDGDELSLLFEVRASHMKTQPGDVCFPGGHIEEGETPLESALREMEEEIGIPAASAEVLGQFDTLYGFSGYSLFTYIVKVDKTSLDNLKLSENEVAEVFTVPLKFFKDTPAKDYSIDVVSVTKDFPYDEVGIPSDYNWRVGKNVIPVYHYDGHVIWGMTGRIVEWLAKELL